METQKAYKCTNPDCEWRGTEDEKAKKYNSNLTQYVLVCPDCCSKNFDMLHKYKPREVKTYTSIVPLYRPSHFKKQ